MKVRNKKIFKILGAVFIWHVIVFGVIIYRFYTLENTDLKENAERIANSSYYKFEDKIYRLVGTVLLEIEGVDAASFEPVGEPYSYANVARDKSHVYCGAQIMEGLDSAHVKQISPQYYASGGVSYFCSSKSAEVNVIVYLTKIFFNTFGLAKFPQKHYPHSRLDTSARIAPLGRSENIVTDGKLAFYKGQILRGADAANLKQMPSKHFIYGGAEPERRDELSDDVLTDGRKIFWEAKEINFTPSEQIYLIEGNNKVKYLYEPAGGAVYMYGEKFDPANEPYVPINKQTKSDNYVLFASKNGIFYMSADKFLNREKKGFFSDIFSWFYYKFNASELSSLKKAGENPFTGEVRQISQRVFRDDKSFYYLHFRGERFYSHGRHGRHLEKEINFIRLYRLVNLGVSDEGVVAQIAQETARNPEKSQLVLDVQDITYKSEIDNYVFSFLFLMFVFACVASLIKKRRLKNAAKNAV